MTPEEKDYIAGIIDGEGSIMLISFHSNQLPSPCISISSSTIELLEWIKLKVKAGTIKAKKNYNEDKHKLSYTYTLRYNSAIDFLQEVEPYLVINSKKARAQLIISEYKKLTPRNGRYTEDMLNQKQLLYEKFLKLK